MTVWAFYWLVLKRAGKRSYGLARHIPFWVAIALGILLFIGRYAIPWYYPPPYQLPPAVSWWLTKAVEFSWTVPVAFLILYFLWLVIRGPHELYHEKAIALETARYGRTAEGDREKVRDWLSTELKIGQHYLAQTGNVVFMIPATQEAAVWSLKLDASIEERLNVSYRVRFAHGGAIPSLSYIMPLGDELKNEAREALKARCNNLYDILKEFW